MSRSRLSTLPLGALRAFEAAARLGSFKAAATELSVTPAAISHQVKGLEDHLGLILFERLNRALRLTAGGERLAAVATESFGRLDRVLGELEESGLTAGPGTLTISAAPTIAAKWLVPRLHRFEGLHRGIDLRLQAGDNLVDLLSGTSVDVALRYGPGDYGPGLHAEQLWPQGRIVAVCAPSLAGKNLQKPADVLRYSLLRTAVPAMRQKVSRGPDDIAGWPAWLAAAEVMTAEEALHQVSLGPLFGTSQLALEAAVMGRGLALVPEMVITDDLAAGRLIQPFAIAIADIFAYWLVYAESRALETRIKAFANWVRDEAKETAATGTC